MFYVRWQMTRGLIALALWIAPRGPARSMLLVYLNGDIILDVPKAIT